MKIAIMGGAGFVGSALVRRLAGDHEIYVFDNYSRGVPQNLKGSAVAITRIDLCENEPSLEGFDRVYDLAARVAGARDLYRDPATLLRDNLRITGSVLEAVARAGVPYYFFVSSSCVYDFPGAKVPHVEEDTGICDTSYGLSKQIGEEMTRWYSRQYGFQVRIARLFNVYGPGDSPLSPHVIPEFFRKAEQAKTTGVFPIFGSGTQTRDFTWIGDVVEGLVTVAERGTHLQPYNIGGGSEYSIADLAKIVCEETGVSARFVTEDMPPPPEDIQRRSADNSKLRALGWAPEVGLRQGIRRMTERVTA